LSVSQTAVRINKLKRVAILAPECFREVGNPSEKPGKILDKPEWQSKAALRAYRPLLIPPVARETLYYCCSTVSCFSGVV